MFRLFPEPRPWATAPARHRCPHVVLLQSRRAGPSSTRCAFAAHRTSDPALQSGRRAAVRTPSPCRPRRSRLKRLDKHRRRPRPSLAARSAPSRCAARIVGGGTCAHATGHLVPGTGRLSARLHRLVGRGQARRWASLGERRQIAKSLRVRGQWLSSTPARDSLSWTVALAASPR